MTTTSENPPEPNESNSPDVLREFDAVGEEFQKGLVSDPRLDSGVPDHMRSEDIDFIQMSGLANPKPSTEGEGSVTNETAPRPIPTGDDPAGGSVSFYEKGVEDVDSTMAPGLIEAAESADQELHVEAPERKHIAHLRDMIADLSGDEAVSAGVDSTDDIELRSVSHDAVAAYENLSGTPEHGTSEARHSPPDLSEAERLIDAIEQPAAGRVTQSRRAAVRPTPKSHGAAPDDENITDLGTARRRRSAGRGRKHRLQKLVLAAALLLACAAGLYAAAGTIRAQLTGPGRLYREAQADARAGRLKDASDLFEQFASRFVNHEARPEAQFNAAFYRQQMQSTSMDDRTRDYQKALSLFEQFCNDNPTHPKVARARILMGRLQYELGEYESAIETLRDPELRLRDPVAAVPALRTLARSFAQLGQAESARSYYLQSVGMQDNHSPDVDFRDLGDLYHAMAERTTEEEEKSRLALLAVEQWTQAAQVAGIDPASRKELRTKADVLREQFGGIGPVQLTAPDGSDESSSWDDEPSFEDIPEDAPAEVTVEPDAATAEGTEGSP